MAQLLDALAVVDDILDARNTGLDSSGDQRTSGDESDLVDAFERVRNFGLRAIVLSEKELNRIENAVYIQ